MTRTISIVVVTIGLLFATDIVCGQGRGPYGGGPGRGPYGGPGMGGGPGIGPGGMRGPYGGGMGGRPGGGGGPGSPFNGSDFIKRMDRNGNGMIEPDEAQGPASFFLKRVASSSNLDLSKPISVEKLNNEMQRMRGGPPSGSGDRDSQGSKDKDEPLVPGFGVVDGEVPLVPGFGEVDEFLNVRVTDRDRSDAERGFQYYDRNRDGVLDREEMSRSRSGDLERYDKNKDGKLTLSEMAVRYARRRLDNEERSSASSSSSSKKSSSSSSSSKKKRWSWTSKSSSKKSKPEIYKVKTAHERLPSGIPQSFRDKDNNLDGQLAMAEYASNWNDQLIREFAELDLNGDYVITPKEYLAAKEGSKSKSSKYSGSSSKYSSSKYSSRRPSPSSSSARKEPPKSSTQKPLAETKPKDEPETSVNKPASEKPTEKSDPVVESPVEKTVKQADVSPAYISYAKGLIGKYDKDGDGMLVSAEWNEISKNPAKADTNADGKITATEYAIFLTKP